MYGLTDKSVIYERFNMNYYLAAKATRNKDTCIAKSSLLYCPEKILRLPQVMEITGLSRSSIYALMKDGKFPKSVKISRRSAGWWSGQVSAHQEALFVASNSAAVIKEAA
jgi:prophage regulatory protein